MIWKLVDGKPVAVEAQQIVPSGCGPIAVYNVNGETYLQTDDMLSMGFFRERFLNTEMPKVRKALDIQTNEDKVKNLIK